jgi:DNA-binding NarL/FixJ family response regulator
VTEPEPGYGVVLCDDLIFFSKVAAVAKALGLAVRQVRTPAAVLDLARKHPPGGVILDLHHDGLDVPGLLAGLREVCPAMPRTVAYGSHVEAETLRAARKAGCDRVLPRSQFVEELPTDLRAWLTPVITPPAG